MKSIKKIGLIGMGSIGTYVYENLRQSGIEITFIYTRKKMEHQAFSHLVINTPQALESKCKEGVDLVVEVATFEAVRDLALIVLKYTDMAIFSSTALADENFHTKVQECCKQYGHRLFVPHGAVMGLDGIMDARGVLESVTITTTKSPQSLGRADTIRTTVYEGATRQACALYPRNVNVHATTALAGLGFDQTKSVIISDPDAPGNMHEIEVKANAFQFKIQTLSDTASAVSSAYTLISACAVIKRILLKEGISVV